MMRRQTTRTAQRGMTTLGLIILLAFLGIFAYAGIRLVPVYLEDMKISGTFRELKKELNGNGADKRTIQNSISRRFDVESVRVISYRDVSVRRVGNGYEVKIEYTNKTPFLGNISFAVDFFHRVEIER